MHRQLLLLTVSMLFALGLVMIYNTTSAEILDHDLEKNTLVSVFKQVAYGIAGLLIALWICKRGHRTFLAKSPYLLALFTFFLVLCFVPVIGREVNGSHRWLSLAGLSFQPSEFVKYIAPAFFITRMLQWDVEGRTFQRFLKVAGLLAVPLFLILIEPNNGTVGVIVMTLFMLCLMLRIKLKYWAWPFVIAIAVASVSVTQLPYVKARLRVYWNPEMDLLGKGHQPYQAKIAAGSGGLFGRGPGSSLQKLSYLPEAQNDYIAAIYAEEFGFVGIVLLIFLYMFLAFLGFSIALQSPIQESCYLAMAVTFLISFQAFMNLGVVSGLLPSTGLNLPFFSQGGTSLIANLMGIGLLWDVARLPCQVRN